MSSSPTGYDSNDVGVVRINDVFTRFQLSQLKVLKATHTVTPNFAQLPEAEVIHIQYNRRFTEDTELPPNLTELEIKSSFAITAFPPQLITFGIIANGIGDVSISSPTLSFLLVNAAQVTIECPNLVELSLENVHTVHLSVDSNLVQMKVEGSRASHIPLDRNFINHCETDSSTAMVCFVIS